MATQTKILPGFFFYVNAWGEECYCCINLDGYSCRVRRCIENGKTVGWCIYSFHPDNTAMCGQFHKTWKALAAQMKLDLD